jgi:hypothetical protein
VVTLVLLVVLEAILGTLFMLIHELDIRLQKILKLVYLAVLLGKILLTLHQHFSVLVLLRITILEEISF